MPRAIEAAIAAGIRLFDTSPNYEVGILMVQSLKQTGLRREEIIIVEQVGKPSTSQHLNSIYRKQLRRSLSLDEYPSRDALFGAAEKYLFSQNVKRMVTLPFRAMERLNRNVKRVVIQGTNKCS